MLLVKLSDESNGMGLDMGLDISSGIGGMETSNVSNGSSNGKQ